jgi:hypothetical protein
LHGVFFSIAALCAIVGVAGIMSIRVSYDADTVLYDRVSVPLGALAIISGNVQRVRANLATSMLQKKQVDVENAIDRMNGFSRTSKTRKRYTGRRS